MKAFVSINDSGKTSDFDLSGSDKVLDILKVRLNLPFQTQSYNVSELTSDVDVAKKC
jgi:hypothetical protein